MCQAESDLGGEELQLRLEAVAVAWLAVAPLPCFF